jgi:hypothetical protein
MVRAPHQREFGACKREDRWGQPIRQAELASPAGLNGMLDVGRIELEGWLDAA